MDLRARPGTAMLLDCAGTLISPAEPVPVVYARIAAEHGVEVSPRQIATTLPTVMRRARPLRAGDPYWARYWNEVMRGSIGSMVPELLDAVVGHFARPPAWRMAAGALECIADLRAAGMRVVIVSNWDRRLRGLLGGLGVIERVDDVVVSAELDIEKPDVRIFTHACELAGVDPAQAVHVGDSPSDDRDGARAAGCRALLYGVDIDGFADLRRRLLAD